MRELLSICNNIKFITSPKWSDNNHFVLVSLLTMQAQIHAALQNSLIGDNAMLKQSNEQLSQLAKIEGYCTSLMQIINEPNLKSDIKQAALIQLKNNVKAKWKPKNEKIGLTAGQKNAIRNALIKAIVLCAKQYKLIKLYREVLTTVVGYEYQTWIPMKQIIQIIASGTNLEPVFHCIIAICTNFQFSVIEKQKATYNLFLKEILPIVLKTVAENLTNTELLYLSLKILWKSVHYEINNQIKALTNDWMGLLYQIINQISPEMQSKLDQYQPKNTPQFYYYHSKKWATRILMRFIQKHAKACFFGKINPDNVEYSKMWYQNYGIKLCQTIFLQLKQGIPTTKKIRYFQLKIVQGVVNDRPDLISQSARIFQYDVLLKYMVVTKEDNDLANNDVVQYMRLDDESSMTYSNIKRVATQVWNSFFQLQSRFDRDKSLYTPGPLFQENLNFMFEKIKSENLLEKEMGMYLFCENRTTINRSPEVKSKMPSIIDIYVVPLLSDSNILIRARANDMITEYGKQIHDVNIISKCLQGVYACLVNDSSPLVKIKAAIALNSLVWHPQAKIFITDYLKTILTVYLHLIEKYDLEQVVSALQYFIGDFSESIGPFSIELFKYLLKFFSSMFKKDIELSQNQEYGSEVQLAASGCIKTMTQIIQSPLDPQIRAQIQPLVLQLCAFLFTNQSYDYHQDMFFLLRVHLQKVDKITPHCWFFYQVLIYFIVGIPNDQWNQIQGSALPQANKQILSCVREGNNFQFLQFIVPILRNYLGKGYTMIIAQKDQFKLNVVHLILYLVVQVYKKGINVEIEGEIHLDCCSILLVYVFETFPPEITKSIVAPVWNVCKYNITKGETNYIKQITAQLISVTLWKHGAQFLQILASQNCFPTFMKYMTKISLSLQEYQEKKRVILGICSYLLLVNNQQILLTNVPSLVQVLFKLVKKNCIARVILNTKDQELKKKMLEIKESDDDVENGCNEDEDDDDMWDEEYNQKHCSILKTINQLAGFRQIMQKLNSENPNLFQLIVASIASKKLQQVQQLLENAIQLPQR